MSRGGQVSPYPLGYNVKGKADLVKLFCRDTVSLKAATRRGGGVDVDEPPETL